jgi:hypothetical protein
MLSGGPDLRLSGRRWVVTPSQPSHDTWPSNCGFATRATARPRWVIRLQNRRRGADSSAPLLTSLWPSLRRLDLNQRPLGYEFCRSRSAEAFPLVTGGVRSAEITSGHPTWAKVGQKPEVESPDNSNDDSWSLPSAAAKPLAHRRRLSGSDILGRADHVFDRERFADQQNQRPS